MARFTSSFKASNAGDLADAINDFLATLTDPTIRCVEYSLVRSDGRIGDEYSAIIRYDSGGAALATQFFVRIDEASVLSTANTALQAFLTANAAYFVGGTRLQMVDGEQTFRKFSLLTMYNATGGASANYSAL